MALSETVRARPLRRNRDFLLYATGQGISLAGDNISQVAFPLLVLAITGSGLQAGLAVALQAIPYLLLSLPAGALVDRWDRKRVMIICDVGRALTLVSIPVALALHHLTVAQLYICPAIEGTLLVFFNVAAFAVLPHVVATEQLTEAMGATQASYNLAALIGPPLGTALYFGIGRAVPFLVDAASYLVSVVTLRGVRTAFQEQSAESASRLSVADQLRRVGGDIRDGIAWMLRHPLLRFMPLLGFGMNLAISANQLLVILLARRLHALPATGAIFAIASVGGFTGALVAPRLQRRFRFGPVITAGFCGMVLLQPLYLLASGPVALGLITGGVFLLETLISTVNIAYRVALTPDALRSRITSIHRLVAFSGIPIGYLLVGALDSPNGSTLAIALLTIILAVTALASALHPQVQRQPQLTSTPAM